MECPCCGANVPCPHCEARPVDMSKRIEFLPGKAPDPETAALIVCNFGCSLDGPREYLLAVEREIAKIVTERRTTTKEE